VTGVAGGGASPCRRPDRPSRWDEETAIDTYIVPGFIIGCIYAIAASGVVLTYATSGVLNLAYGAIAYVNATLFWSFVNHGLSGWLAAAICVLGISPLIGVILWQALFRFIVHLSLVAGLIASIGLAVALPAAIDTILPHKQVLYARGIVTPGFKIHHWGPVKVSTDQVSVLVGAVGLAIALFWLLRYTQLGLRMRAVFDNRTIALLAGVSGDRVSTFSWAMSASLAGLGGILLAPVLSLTSSAFLTVTVASLAAALVGGMRSIAITFVAAIGIGVASSVISAANAGNNLLAAGIQPSLPFIVMVAALLFRRRPLALGMPGMIIRFVNSGDRGGVASVIRLWPLLVLVLLTQFFLSGYWTGIVALGLVYSVIFLSFTIALGDAGMIPLGQAAIVGVGGFTAGALISSGWPVMVAVLAGGLAALGAGVVLAFAGGRLGALEFALLTLAFALFCANFLFLWGTFVPLGGANFPTPSIFGLSINSPVSQLYLFAICLVGALAIYWFLHRHTAGFILNAVRLNVGLAEATGMNARNGRILALSLSSFLAGVGGGLLGVYQLHLGIDDVAAPIGLLWLAIVVTMGIRTPVAAVVGGLIIALLPAILTKILPIRYGAVPTILFGLGGLALASDPRGTVSYYQGIGSRVVTLVRTRITTKSIVIPEPSHGSSR
jgi:branched-chain amino acid transport system permease protein